jgi:hypothetical protein
MRTANGVCPVCEQSFEYDVRPGTRPIYCSPEHRNKAGNDRRRLNWTTLSERRCARCELTKPLKDFPGPHAYCRACHAARARERRKLLGAADPSIIKEWELRRYGLTPASFDAMITAQDGKCAICRSPEPGGQGVWHVDHDHACHARKQACDKCRRGLLCSRCNIGIGNLRDDPRIIQAALDYLTAHREHQERFS